MRGCRGGGRLGGGVNVQEELQQDSDAGFRYEDRLNRDWHLAISEGSKYFENSGSVQEALRKIAGRLKSLNVSYCIVGGMALFRHGFRRFTEDVDILVSKEELTIIHKELEGSGYRPPFQHSKNLRDTDLGVRIEFLVVGEFPGDGKPKPVFFPNPADASTEIDGISYLNLNALVELKLASGMTEFSRLKDLADVIELIKVLQLPRGFSEHLNPYVREKYEELWLSVRTRFVKSWDGSIEPDAASLQAMLAEGVVREADGVLVTYDPSVAEKYDMHPGDEYMGG